MKINQFIILILLFMSSHFLVWNLLETVDEAKMRRDSEVYQQYQDNDYRRPLGGYDYKMGDSAPDGTIEPGMTYNDIY